MAHSEEPLPSFFTQHGLDVTDWQRCLRFVKASCSGYAIDASLAQGGCSYTILLVPQARDRYQIAANQPSEEAPFIVQVRPQRHALSIDTASTAKQWYGHQVPSVVELFRLGGKQGVELIAYGLSYIPGKRFDDLQPSRSTPFDPNFTSKYRNLLDDIVGFYATAWKTGAHVLQRGGQGRCEGKVGSSVLWRLRRLEIELASPNLRSTARTARAGVEAGVLDRLPIVFTHGDLLTSNILVDEQTWHINGFIDWAESEFLPFGMSLYGVEHVLGRLSSTPASKRSFVYIGGADCLRQYFWQQLASSIPELEREELRQAAELARTVGILLWHGFAWDDGRIDRVIDPVRDDDELAYLEAFLNTRAGPTVAHL